APLVDAARASDESTPRFRVRAATGAILARSLVVATGGLSWPRLGTSDVGHALARRFGLAVTPIRPGLVPLQWSAADRARFGALAGIAVPARVALGKARFVEAVLFTHGGLSGPAILQISNHWTPGATISVDWLPDVDARALLDDAKASGEVRSARRLFAERLPKRLVDALLDGLAASERPLAQVARRDLDALAARVAAFPFAPAGDAGWDKAEVTLGGVDTHALSSRTLEAKAVPGLHFVGEVVDVTGWLGGFNFQWAWASAHAAGEAV
ncbi:MAG: aminoacetone oxidase family FAD-binding enzyme, partial [Planctomycetes bacterium]|nr:aminoacetone oxidase family FAD-binding enzyme [Planctomycetota bacterium]